MIRDEEGYIRIVDRKKQIICTAVGKNIAPAKLENLFSTSAVVEQIFFIGDERNYISALIVPSFNYFTDLFKKEGISFDENALEWDSSSGADICFKVGDDFIGQQLLSEAIEAEVQKANEQLESFEKIRKYTIIPERFTEANGQLTPTQKTKKRVILEAYTDAIEDMYKD